MNTQSEDAQYTAGRDSFMSYIGTGLWLGTTLGALTILPATILGIITFPVNATLTLLRVIDMCAPFDFVGFFSCSLISLPYVDMAGLQFLSPQIAYLSF